MKQAILLTNLGSPNSPGVADVKKYLSEFLMDERVIDIPYPIRLMLVKGIIVPFRAPKSAAKYQTIWTKQGSPLIHITAQLTHLVEAASGLPTYMCMRYADPAPEKVLKTIAQEQQDLEELTLIPLYPHYAMSSYETGVEHVKAAFQKGKYSFRLKVVPSYFNSPDYIRSLAASIRPLLVEPWDHLLFSYHGIPERHLFKTNYGGKHCLSCDNCCETPDPMHAFCYRHQVKETTRLTAQTLGLNSEKYSYSFQSRLGQDKWLKPYTAKELEAMPARGILKLVVVCPAFVSDCLETLEEIWVEGRESFLKAGGEDFRVVPCLNTNVDWVQTLVELIKTAD